jgi:hypothetical protein
MEAMHTERHAAIDELKAKMSPEQIRRVEMAR